MYYITLDPYYDVLQYNEAVQALHNNQIQYKEYINIKTPFNFYLEISKKPIMVNYDILPNSELKYLVNKVEPATPTDEYLLERKTSYTGTKALRYYVMNKPLLEANKSEYACFFNAKNKTQLLDLSQKLGTIYYFGKYIKNTKIALCTNKMIKNFIPLDNILVEKTKSAIQMEADLNFNYFRLQNRLRKFTETPYFKNGVYNPVNIKKFNVTL